MKTLAFFLCAGVLSFATQADASIYLGVQAAGVNDGAVTQIGSDGGTGSIGYTSFNFGGFVSNITAQGYPTLPQPMLQTNSVDTTSTNAGTLAVYLTQTDLTPITSGLTSSFTANSLLNFGAGLASVSEYTFFDPTNGLFGGTQLASATFSSIGVQQATTAVFGLSGPFSETVKYVINIGAGGGSVNDTINIAAGNVAVPAVPEPATWAMMVLGFGAIGFAMRRRQKITTQFSCAG